MRFYMCIDDDIHGNPCGLHYRELADGRWECRYVGHVMPWAVTAAHWEPITDRSADDLAKKGHTIVEVISEPR